MTESLKQRCELFIGNYAILKRDFKFDNTLFNMIGAGLFASCNSIADSSKIESCRRLIKANSGICSPYRSLIKPYFAVALALDDDAKALLYRTLDAYSAIRKHFTSSYYSAMAAYLLAKYSTEAVTELAAKTHNIYKTMKSLTPRETSHRDIIYAAIRATENKPSSDIVMSEQVCSRRIDGIFPKSQKSRVVHNIAVFGEDHERVGRRLDIMIKLLRTQKYRYGKSYELNVLTALALTEIPEEDIVESIIEVYEYLRERREFSRFAFKRELLMLAAFAVLDENITPSRIVAADAALASTLAEFATIIASQACY